MAISQNKENFSLSAWDICKPRLIAISGSLSLASAEAINVLDNFRAAEYVFATFGTVTSAVVVAGAALFSLDLNRKLIALPGAPPKTPTIIPSVR